MRLRNSYTYSASVLAVAAAAMLTPQEADAVTCNWNGGAGLWSTGANWDCGVPTSADDVFVNTGGAFVTVSGTRNAGTLTIGATDTVEVTNGTLFIHNNALAVDGLLSVSANADFRNAVGTTLVVTGGGNITLSATNSRMFGGDWNFGSNVTVDGFGQIGIGSMTFTNDGLISANVGGQSLIIDPFAGNGGNAGAATVINNGTMQADGGGILDLRGGRYDNTNGLIQAMNTSTVVLNADSRIIGGDLTSDGSSSFESFGSSFLVDTTLTNGSVINMNSGNSLFLNSSFVNNGAVNVGGNTDLRNELSSTLAVTGNGTITMQASNSRMFNGDWDFGSDITVQGQGQIGIGLMTFTNNGLITANVNGATLIVDPFAGNGGNAGAATVTNNNIMQADAGGTLELRGGRYDNANGTIQAINGSAVVLASDSRIIGGDLTSDGSSSFESFGLNYLEDATLTSGSVINMNSGNTLRLNSSFVNNGAVNVGGNTDLINENGGGLLTVSGNGTITLQASNSRMFNGDWDFGSNITVQGQGQIGIGAMTFTNNGLITANVNGATLIIDPFAGSGGNAGAATVINNSIMQADNGGILDLRGGRYDNASGTIQAINGSAVVLAPDSRIIGGFLTSDGTSSFESFGINYLEDAILTSGSVINTNSGNSLFLSNTFVNDGTVNVTGNTDLRNENGGGTLTLSGSGSIIFDDSVANARFFSGEVVNSVGHTIAGSGDLGVGSTTFVNNGLITANVVGGSLDIDPFAGSAGNAGATTFANSGTVRADGGTINLLGGRYTNTAIGTFEATGGGLFNMNNDANLTNLEAGDVLNMGGYTARAGSTLNIRGTGANQVGTIGTGASGTDTVVTLDGAGSQINVLAFSGGAPTSLDASLHTVAQSGRLNLLNGRGMTIVANGGAFSNAGIVELGGGTFSSASYDNGGTTMGFGTIVSPIANTGTVEASGGTLISNGITGTTGTVSTLGGATLDLTGAASGSTAGFLQNDGNLNLGSQNITVTSDYTNANFGTGNSFDHRANVSGSGLLLASNASMDVSGAGLSGGTLSVGNVRVGGSSMTTITITNNGAETLLRGAVQNTNAPSVALTGADFVLNTGGGSHMTTISFTGSTAGSLAGQTIDIVNNFDNVGNQTLQLDGNVYQIAVADALPTSIDLGAVRSGGAVPGANFTIANIAPNTGGFTESLSSNAMVSGPFTLDGGSSVMTADLGPGGSQTISIGLMSGASGNFSETVMISNTSLAVPGSGLSDLALAGQTINLTAKVYQEAIADVSNTTIDFGVVREGTAGVTAGTQITNTATGALVDDLVTSTSGLSAPISENSVPGPLGSGQSGNAVFALDTSSAGEVNGTGSLDFVSTNSDLGDLSIGSQNVAFSGTVTDIAEAVLFQQGGDGSFSGGGMTYDLDFGTINSGSGSLSFELGILNDILNTSFSESLGGDFVFGGGSGYSFSGGSFSGIDGGQSQIGNFLMFDYTGLGNGTYNSSLTFNGFSQFPGLNDFSLAPINVNITATITGGQTAPVPEPGTWLMMILGFGLVGLSMRRNASGRRQARIRVDYK